MSDQQRISLWVEKHIHRDFREKNILITGSDSGIGFALAQMLVGLHAHVFLIGRNEAKCQKAKEEILLCHPEEKVDVLLCNLSEFSSIDSFLNEIQERKLDIDVFINNAGIFHLPQSYNSTKQEKTMMTNYIGMKYLNDRLLEYLKTLPHECEVIITTSLSAHWAKLDYENFFLEKNYSKAQIYGNSKLCCLHYFETCLEKYQGTNLQFYLTHPGACYTPLIDKAYSKGFLLIAKPAMKLFFHSPRKAALVMLKALEDKKNGSYVVPRGLFRFSGYPKQARLPKRLKKNYQKTEEFTNELLRKERES